MTRFIKRRKSKDIKREERLQEHSEIKIESISEDRLSIHMETNLNKLQETLGQSDDFIIREFSYEGNRQQKAALIFFDGLISNEVIDERILKTLMYSIQHSTQSIFSPQEAAKHFKQAVLPIGDVKESNEWRELVKHILVGDAILVIDGCTEALILSAKGYEKRSIQEPMTESVVRGPRDSFTENLRTNTVLIRRRLRDPDLRIKTMTIGTRSHTDIAIVYLEGVADENIVQEVEERIKEIEIDGVISTGYIEQFIEDSHWSPFPLIQNTERPDKATANLLEGKVVIIADGSPFALIAPAVLTQFYQSPEDYYERFLISSLIRLLRVLAMSISLLLPSLYIAFSSFHPEMIPSKLVIAMAAGRATVPFPSAVEALVMELSIEILREASVRLPGPIGPTVGIVGALVIGEAAVQAGIVSPIMVIVVALTTIGSFAAPSYNAAIALRMLRFPLMLLAAVLGLYGIMLFIILIVIHLCSLKSFGVPYLAPLTPSNLAGIGDTFLRAPLYRMKNRPSEFVKDDEQQRLDPSSAEGVAPHDPKTKA